MHILLQDCTTKQFYRDNGSLTANAQDAKHFVSTAQATEFAVHFGKLDVQIVMAFGSPHLDVVLPLTGCRKEPRR